ncbi:MAG: glycosyltransferase family A protein [Thermodesulfobacteriota bacterium]
MGFLFFWIIQKFNLPAKDPPSAPPLSIIIPARNEENNLGRLLRSLAGQISFPSGIIVVDDHSEDATARIAGGFPVRIIPSPDLPPGWIGKTWACRQGEQKAQHNLLLFLDADTFFEPYGLSRLRKVFEEKGIFLSLQPFPLMQKAFEQLSAYFNILEIRRLFFPPGPLFSSFKNRPSLTSKEGRP